MNSINLRNILVLLMVLSLNTNVMAAFTRLNGETTAFLKVSDKVLDLSKSAKTVIKVDAKAMRTGYSNYFKLDIYEKDAEENKLSIARINSKISNRKAVEILVPLGRFDSSSKTVHFDLYNSAGDKVDTYSAQFNAINLDKQYTSIAQEQDSDCDSSIFGTCQLDYILSKLNFNTASPNKTTTLVSKSEDGSYTVSIPSRGATRNTGKASKISIPVVSDDVTETFTGGEVSHLKIKGEEGKAPLVLSTASLLEDKVSGAIEFAKGKLYFTNNAGRKALATIEDVQQAQPSLGNYVTKIQLNKAIAAVPTGTAFFTSGSSAGAIQYGANADASGGHAIALGNGVTASGEDSTAMGYDTTASGGVQQPWGITLLQVVTDLPPWGIPLMQLDGSIYRHGGNTTASAKIYRHG